MKSLRSDGAPSGENLRTGARSCRRGRAATPSLGRPGPVLVRLVSTPMQFPAGGTDYRLETVWPTPPDGVQQDVVRFWLAESAMTDPAAAQERAHQLLVVARDLSGQVAGVSTAVRVFVPQLGFECFYYRTFVGRAHRTRGLRSTGIFWSIVRKSYAVLNERFREGCDPGVLGAYVEIENASLMRVRNDAVWREGGMNVVYIGRTPDGRHVRVWYFDGRGRFREIPPPSIGETERITATRFAPCPEGTRPCSSSDALVQAMLVLSRVHPSGHRLRLEPLEDRRLLAVVTVDTELDVVDLYDGVTSLREAISATNDAPGPDEIVFDFGHDGPATILLEQGELKITDALAITGDGPDLLTIDAQQNSRIFNIVATTGDFTLAGMTLTGGSGERQRRSDPLADVRESDDRSLRHPRQCGYRPGGPGRRGVC